MKPFFEDPGDRSDKPTGEPRHPMAPLNQRRLRQGHPPQAIPIRDRDDQEALDEEAPRGRRQDLDPIVGYLLAMALAVGLLPVQANLRYVLLWTFMASMGTIAFLLGSGIRLKVSDPGNLVWGTGLGLLAGSGMILAGADTLATAGERIFGIEDEESTLLLTWIFQATAFVMPIAETLFFRGAMQRVHSIPVVALLATAWSMLMFFPNLDLGDTPVVATVITVALALLNSLYSYVHMRHGLAASLFCQVTAGTLLLFVPQLLI